MTEEELGVERWMQRNPERVREINSMTPEQLLRELKRNVSDSVTYGVLVRGGSLWIGAHWSAANKRLCVNLIPCVTIWFVMPGGYEP